MNNTNDEQDHVDDQSGILVEEFIKIHDPEDDTILYEGRA